MSPSIQAKLIALKRQRDMVNKDYEIYSHKRGAAARAKKKIDERILDILAHVVEQDEIEKLSE
ncbi:MAG TPA: hypothetical protein ENH85_12365 [Candidatus Scalindua sp.]|nr:hypothetical protein [Candidatus Scalindua sp.]